MRKNKPNEHISLISIRHNRWGSGAVLFVLAGIAVSLYVSFFYRFPYLQKTEEWGQLGDFIGGTMNPLVSFLTLAVAIEVWLLQKLEMHETKAALLDQAQTANRQRQEQRFFDLLNLYHRTVDTVALTATNTLSDEATLKGKQVFTLLLNRRGLPPTLQTINQFVKEGFCFRKELPLGATLHDHARDAMHPEYITLTKSDLEKVWQNQSGFLDHYFRAVFRILAEAEGLLGDERFRYIKLLRAQFSKDEVQLLALNMWLDPEGKKMIGLAETYGLLKHLPEGHLRSALENEFPAAVFGVGFVVSRQATATTI